MSAKLAASLLNSRIVRGQVVQTGTRKLTSSVAARRDAGGLKGAFLRFTSNLFGFIVNSFGTIISWTFTALWSGIVQTTQFAFNFDWNIADAAIDKQISTAFDSLGGLFGSTLGTIAGYTTCGVLPGLAIYYFNKPLAVSILYEVGDEFAEELAEKLTALIRASLTRIRTVSFFYLYKNIRTLWRESDDKFRKRLQQGGLKKEYVDAAIEERNKPWILSQKIEKRKDAIKSKFWREFAEEFLEEFGESCIEAGFVVARAADDWYAQQKLSQQINQGSQRTVEVEFKDDGTTEINEIKTSTNTRR